MKRFALLATVLLFTGCTPKSVMDGVEGIFVDEQVVNAKNSNYSLPANSGGAIIHEKSKSKPATQKSLSQTISKSGHISSSSYDSDVKLYIYTLEADDGEIVTFFYDKKLPIKPNDLLVVTIKDNYLINYTKKGSSPSLTPTQKKLKFLQHKRKRSKIQTPIEEKIDTF